MAVKNRYNTLIEEECEQYDDKEIIIEHKWKCFKESIHQAAKETIPKKEKERNKSWMTDDILAMMEERRVKQNTPDYEIINKSIKKACKKAKEDWYNERCREIETLESNYNM